MKTTFQKIRDKKPCASGWEKLVGYYHPESLDEEVSFEEIIKSNGIKDAIWALRCIDDKDNVALFCADIAESVLTIYEERNKENKAPRECINAIRLYVKGDISKNTLLEKNHAAAAAAYAAYAADAVAAAAAAAAVAAVAAAAVAAADDAAYVAAAAADAAAYVAADADAARETKWQEITSLFFKYFK